MKTIVLAAIIAVGLVWPAHSAGNGASTGSGISTGNSASTGNGSPLLVSILGNDYASYASVEGGAAFVKLHEWVYGDSGSDAKISAIDYDMGFNGGFRLGLGFEPYNKLKKIGLGISGLYASYLPVNGGGVSDSDWDYNGMMFSKGTGTANSAAFTDIKGKIQLYIPLGKITALVLMTKLWYCRYAATANGGWIQQAATGEAWNDDLPKEPLYGMSMMYIQEWLTIAPGVGVWIQLGRHSINLCATVWGGVWGNHLDYHYFRKIDPSDSAERYVIYKDNVKGNLSVCVEAEWRYPLKRYGEIGITFGCKTVPKARGSSRIMTAGLLDYVYYEDGAAGASIMQIYGGLSYRLWL